MIRTRLHIAHTTIAFFASSGISALGLAELWGSNRLHTGELSEPGPASNVSPDRNATWYSGFDNKVSL